MGPVELAMASLYHARATMNVTRCDCCHIHQSNLTPHSVCISTAGEGVAATPNQHFEGTPCTALSTMLMHPGPMFTWTSSCASVYTEYFHCNESNCTRSIEPLACDIVTHKSSTTNVKHFSLLHRWVLRDDSTVLVATCKVAILGVAASEEIAHTGRGVVAVIRLYWVVHCHRMYCGR